MKIKILIGIIAVLLATSYALFVGYKNERKERIRHESNEHELTKNINQVNMVLNLERKDFERMNTSWSNKIDSLIKSNKMALKSVKSATIIQTVYKDTTIVNITQSEPQKQPDSSYFIPVTSNNGCWGIKGYIRSEDENSTLTITERTANNSVQLLVLRKRFIGFLWYMNRKTEYKAFSDCGDATFNQINFVEK